ncbi:MAG TPA: hypothetical protein VGF45_14155 [Polyangia bacterium]
MSPEARRLIELTRAARTPRMEDKERVRRTLALSLAAGAAAAPGIADGALALKAATAGTAGTVKAAGVAATVKLALSALVVASVGSGAYLWQASKRQATPVAANPPAEVVAPVAAPAPVVEAPAPVPVETAPATATETVTDPLLAEVGLLHRAQQAWRGGNAKRALQLAQQHAKQYPHSALALERDALRVFTMCALGQKKQARTIAKDLMKRAPRSPLRTSVAESCGIR